MTTTGQLSLNNFYRSVQISHPRLASRMSDDIYTIALYGLVTDKATGQEAAERLRRMAFDLPEIHRRVLENALIDLGYL